MNMLNAGTTTAPLTRLTDEQWDQVRLLIPPEKNLGRHRSTDLRAVMEAILYRWKHNCGWRKLPKAYPPWGTVYTYYKDWVKAGALEEMMHTLKLLGQDFPTSSSASDHRLLQEPVAV